MVNDYQSVKYRQQYLWHSELLGHAAVYTPFLDVNGQPIADSNGVNITVSAPDACGLTATQASAPYCFFLKGL